MDYISFKFIYLFFPLNLIKISVGREITDLLGCIFLYVLRLKSQLLKFMKLIYVPFEILSHVSTRNTVLACFCTLSMFDEHCAIMGGVGINSLCTSCIKPDF